MNLRIVEEPVTAAALAGYSSVSIAFTVHSRLRVELLAGGLSGVSLVEEPVSPAWFKDYDLDESPVRWAELWDVSHWGLFAAFEGNRRVGSAIAAWNTPGVDFLRRQTDVAAVWDLRVAQNHRGQGIGSQLFERVAGWARERKCRLLKVETQNINVEACRFYQARGCVLGSVDRFAYPQHPEETQLVWFLQL